MNGFAQNSFAIIFTLNRYNFCTIILIVKIAFINKHQINRLNCNKLEKQTMRKYFILTFIFLSLIITNSFAQEKYEECTVGVASGKATVDGRPLLWKNRDTHVLNNEINYFSDGRFNYLALVSAGQLNLAWAGVNEMGFCIMNSASKDLKGDSKNGLGNGAFMKEALKSCTSVKEFEEMLEQTNADGRTTNANFGVIDAFGGAAIFETGNYSYTRFDATNPKVAPDGYIVRSNFAVTGGGDGGKIRYIRGQELWKRAVAQKQLSHKHILRTIVRDMADENGVQYSIPLQEKIAGNPGLTINTYATINRPSTASVAVFHGVKDGEHPSLTTFWAVLGEPIFSVAVPCWIISDLVAPELDGEKHSPLCTSVLKIKQSNYFNYGRKKRFLKTNSLKEIWKVTYPVEDRIFWQTDKVLAQWRKSYPTANVVSEFHKKMAFRAMNAIQKVENDLIVPIDSIRVAVFADFGASGICVQEALAALEIDPEIVPRKISGVEIAQGELKKLDVILFPGGSGSRQSNSLGDVGRKKVIDFVEHGGGFVGICAGAYLGSDHPDYDWCLHLADAHVVDREHYARGEGLVKVKLTSKGKKLLTEFNGKENFFSFYHDGPLLAPGNNPDIEDYETLALFESDIHLENDAPAGVMPGSTFLLRAARGNGKVVLCAGHPESTPGIRWLVPEAARWTTQQETIDYLPAFLKTNKFLTEILFDKDWLKQESILLKKLVAKNKGEKLSAMKKLSEMGSRKFPRWLTGQLRDEDPRVRKLTTEMLLDLDCLPAYSDLKQALADEKNAEVKQLMEKVMYELQLN